MKKALYASIEDAEMKYLVTSSFKEEKKIVKWGRFDMRALMQKVNDLIPADGRAEVVPKQITAGRRDTVRVKYTVGTRGLKCGAKLVLFLPACWGSRMLERDINAFAIPEAKGVTLGYLSGHITAQCSNVSARVEGTVTCAGSVHTAVDLEVMDSDLVGGDVITFIIGDSSGNPSIGIEFSGNYKFALAIDEKGDGEYRRVGEYPSIEVVGDVASGFHVSVPSVIEPGEYFKVSITPVDRYMNKASCYQGNISIKFVGKSEFITEKYEYSQDEGRSGVMTVESPSLKEQGLYQVVVADLENGLSGISNPMYIGNWSEKEKVYFGDIHAHTEISDGIGLAEDAYIYGRDVLHHNFGALSDHFEEGQPTLFYAQKEKWPLTVAAAEKFNASGEFATLLGYEWIADQTHKNVYYRDGEGAIYSGSHAETSSKEKQMEFMKKYECIAIPHHPKYLTPVKWDIHNPDIQRLAEIYSVWGSSENGSESSIVEALNIGWKLGIIAGTDNHIGRLGLGNIIVEGCGIAAVMASELSREAIYDALKARRCYGTTGARILLDFRLNGKPMGSEININDKQERKITAKIGGQYDLEEIEIIKNGNVVYSIKPQGKFSFVEWKDSTEFVRGEQPHDYYYLRVSQKDGHRAWSSPIFVSF